MSTLFHTPPIRTFNGIPVFVVADEYVENYQRISEDHVATLRKDGSNPFILGHIARALEQSTASLVSEFSSKDDRILDVGVGVGRLLESFPHLRRYGADVSLTYLQIAQEKGIDVTCAMAESLPYVNRLFDVVVCTDVLEHVFDLNKAVSELRRVLRPGGVAIIRVPYREELAYYLQESYPYKFAHLRNFDENSLRLLFTRIFSLRYLKHEFSYAIAASALRIPLPRGASFLERLLSRLSANRPRLYSWMARHFFRPVEINVVVQKQIGASA